MSDAKRNGHFVGLVAEARFIEWAASNRWPIYRGMDGHEPYDFVLDVDGELVRVEVKGAWREYNYESQGSGRFIFTVTKVKSKKFDWLFVATPQGNYWIPSSECPTTLSIGVHGTVSRSKWEAYRLQEGGHPYVESTS